MDKYPIKVFSKYVDDNKSSLAGIGVIATIAALFLNLDQSFFGESVRNLQLLLLLFLILGLVFLTISSFLWFKENSDSWFSGLIIFSLGLTTWRVCEFVLSNFREELNKYLFLIFISVIFIIYSFFYNLKKKAELDIEKKFVGALSKAILYGIVAFLFFYLPNVFLGFYSDFVQSKAISATQFLESFSKPVGWLFAIWITVAEFCNSFFFTKERYRLWLSILLLSVLGISFLAIFWPVILDLICILKTSC